LINKAGWYFKHTALDVIIALSAGLCLVEVFSTNLVGDFTA